MSFADDMFKAFYALGRFEDDLGTELEKLGIPDQEYNDLTWDHYDYSVEFKDACPHFRLTPEQLKGIWELGFHRLWICHADGWETYYHKDIDQSFVNVRGERRIALAAMFMQALLSATPKRLK